MIRVTIQRVRADVPAATASVLSVLGLMFGVVDDAAAVVTAATGYDVRLLVEDTRLHGQAGILALDPDAVLVSRWFVAPSTPAALLHVNFAGPSPTFTTVNLGRVMSYPSRSLLGDGTAPAGTSVVVADINANGSNECCGGSLFKFDLASCLAAGGTCPGAAVTTLPGPVENSSRTDPLALVLSPGHDFGTGLYVLDMEGVSPYAPNVYQVRANTTLSTLYSGWALDDSLRDIASRVPVSFGQHLYVVRSQLAPPSIDRVDPTGARNSFLAGAPLVDPIAIAFGRGGGFGEDLYVLDQGGGFVLRITPSAVATTIVSGLPTSGLVGLADMAFTSDGSRLRIGYGDSIYEVVTTNCGNGQVDEGEDCDDGNTSGGDSCPAYCVLFPRVCGDGLLAFGEECDDGNRVEADGCDLMCRRELGWSCYGEPSTCKYCEVVVSLADAVSANLLEVVLEYRNSEASIPGEGASANCVYYRGTPIKGGFFNDTADGVVRFAGSSCPAMEGPGNVFGCAFHLPAGGGSIEGVSAHVVRAATFAGGSIVPAPRASVELRCSPRVCGDTLVTDYEECDDGNLENGDGCTTECFLFPVTCGNGTVEPGEECDEALSTSVPNRCRRDCRLPYCGDVITDSLSEECDDGNTGDGDGCSSDCVVEYCGDGILNDGETCEDGNSVSGDGCSPDCQHEGCDGVGCLMFATSTRYSGAMDGFAGADAKCNARAAEAGLTGDFKAWLGSPDGAGTPAASRLNPTSGPFIRTCGGGVIAANLADLLDGYLDLPVGCDEFRSTVDCTGAWTGTQASGAPNSGCANWSTTAGYGGRGDECASDFEWTQGSGDPSDPFRACSESRRIYCMQQDPHPRACGNGVLEVGEECDDGNTAAGDACSADCVTVPLTCGDGLVQLGEECDAGLTAVEPNRCRPDCRPFSCGDGITDFLYEECDDGNSAPGDGCSPDCTFDLSISSPGFCGDYVLQPELGEQCDRGPCGGNCCTSQCVIKPNESCDGAGCGDGFLGVGEECDNGVANSWLPNQCRPTCRNFRCGDNQTDWISEECDDENTVGGDGCSPVCAQESNAARCGDGVAQFPEQCDDGNTANGDCCSSGCLYESPHACTGAQGGCLQAVCNGQGSCGVPLSQGTPCASDSNPCTVDQCNAAGSCVHTAGNAGMVCRVAVGVCDTPDTCNGSSASCPADAFLTTASVCRPAAGVCDVAEKCSGSSAGCPADVLLGSTTTCRTTAGVCDVAEKCTGSATACPADGFAGTGTCRTSAGVCDPAEACTGTSAACPVDTLLSTTTTCRASAGICDVAEKCTGSTTGCPMDGFLGSATSCRGSGGVCDAAEVCTGTSAACPNDVLLSSAISCRAASGVCDSAEKCTGSSASCPPDGFLGTTTVCRVMTGVCDVAESCKGSSAACPADASLPTTATCRSATGICDTAETCTGSTASCPPDGFLGTATACRGSAGVCDVAEMCTGSSATCPSDALRASSVTCRPVAGACDAAETCSGSGASCPPDAFLGTATPCRVVVGACDAVESCTGTGIACPSDVLLPSTATCRATAGVCDAVERCSGSSAACPVDAFLGTTTACRGAVGVCDAAENCSGTLAACPADAVVGTAVACRASTADCDPAEKCDGSAKACPADALALPGTPCSDDQSVCTTDACDGAGTCIHEANQLPCDDGVECNGNDSCLNGICSVHGQTCPDPCDGLTCDDGNPCTIDRCEGAGTCVHDAGNAAVVCRAAAGACDLAELCPGMIAACPADVFVGSNETCRASSGVCDTVEQCTGSSAACPADALAASTTVCRAAAGTCDSAESCTGFASACPPDAFLSASAICRATAGTCDAGESCTGSSATCPPDSLLPSTAICREAIGGCDLAERCNATTPSCPPDGLAAPATPCRPAAGLCDIGESCTGLTTSCPADSLLSSSSVCRESTGICDPAEYCTGAGASCPGDVVATTAVACRLSAGICDPAESCNGFSKLCPADLRSGSSIPCRSAAGVCDAVESCTGTSSDCPVDAFEASTTVCRAAVGTCDDAETCTGSTASCTADGFAANGSDCDDEDPCTENDQCGSGVCGGVVVDGCGGVCGDNNLDAAEECDDGNSSFVAGEYCGVACVRIPCGKPTNSTGADPKTADALFALRAAVGQSNCDLRVCDVDDNRMLVSSDALRILRRAVGQPVTLICPA